MSVRILIIEDNVDNLELMKYLLTAFGYETISAEDGVSGIERIERELPDLVICDIQIPRADGYEVAGRVKMQPKLKDIPLVAITALAMVGDRDKVMGAGFDGYIPKPITPHTFVGEVEAFLPAKLRLAGKNAHFAEPVSEVLEKPAGRAPAGAPRGTILAIDNNRANLELARSIFEPSGYLVATAGGGLEGLEAAKRIRPGLILSDVSMPEFGGYDLVVAIRADPDLNATPVILISSSQSGDRGRAMAAGATKFLKRPIDPGTLLNQVSEIFAQHYGRVRSDKSR